jgi:hypothetical protein
MNESMILVVRNLLASEVLGGMLLRKEGRRLDKLLVQIGMSTRLEVYLLPLCDLVLKHFRFFLEIH